MNKKNKKWLTLALAGALCATTIGAVATAENLKAAIDRAYETVNEIRFDNAYYRHDIGARALKAMKENN